jgi:hypothetical protein
MICSGITEIEWWIRGNDISGDDRSATLHLAVHRCSVIADPNPTLQSHVAEAVTCPVSRMASSGMLRRVALVGTDVSEELSASFIRVTRIGELGTTLAVTSNRRTLRRNTSYIHGKNNDYPAWGFAWLSSTSPAKSSDTAPKRLWTRHPKSFAIHQSP